MKIYRDLEQNTPEWLKARAWVVTWTWLANIMKWWYNKDWTLNSVAIKAMEWYIYELLWWEFSYDDNAPEVKTYLMEQWHILEEEAKIKYMQKMWEIWENIGFIKKNDWIWLSPDWLIFKESKPVKWVEVKSPLWNNGKNFFKYKFEDKIPDEYKWQVVHYFIAIDTLEELDFCVYNPNLAMVDDRLWIKNVTREDLKSEIEEAEKRLEIFRKMWIEKIKILLKK